MKRRKVRISIPTYDNGGGSNSNLNWGPSSKTERKKLLSDVGNPPDMIITLKDDKDYIDGIANWAAVSGADRVSINFNDQIKQGLYSGKYGYNPATGQLINLAKTNASDKQTTLPESEKKYLNKIEDVPYEQAIAEWNKDRVPVQIERGETSWNPSFEFQGLGRTLNTQDFGGGTVYMTQKEADDYLQAQLLSSMEATQRNPLWYAPGMIYTAGTAPALDMLIGAGSAVRPLSEGKYGEAALTAGLGALPFTISKAGTIAKQVDKAGGFIAKEVDKAESIANANKNALKALTSDISSISKETIGAIKGGTKKAVEEGNTWLREWINDPATQQKVTNLFKEKKKGVMVELDDYMQNQEGFKKALIEAGAPEEFVKKAVSEPPQYLTDKLSSIAESEYSAKTFNPSTSLYPLSKQLKELFSEAKAIHSGNDGVFYPDIHRISGRRGAWVSRDPSITNVDKTLTSIHEGTHDWTQGNKALLESGEYDIIQRNLSNEFRQDYYKSKFGPGSQGVNPYTEYLATPTEVHARIMELRKHYGLKPSDIITDDVASYMATDIRSGQTPIDPQFLDVIDKSGGSVSPALVNLFNKLRVAAPVAGGVGLLGSQAQEQKYGGLFKYPHGGDHKPVSHVDEDSPEYREYLIKKALYERSKRDSETLRLLEGNSNIDYRIRDLNRLHNTSKLAKQQIESCPGCAGDSPYIYNDYAYSNSASNNPRGFMNIYNPEGLSSEALAQKYNVTGKIYSWEDDKGYHREVIYTAPKPDHEVRVMAKPPSGPIITETQPIMIDVPDWDKTTNRWVMKKTEEGSPEYLKYLERESWQKTNTPEGKRYVLNTDTGKYELFEDSRAFRFKYGGIFQYPHGGSHDTDDSPPDYAAQAFFSDTQKRRQREEDLKSLGPTVAKAKAIDELRREEAKLKSKRREESSVLNTKSIPNDPAEVILAPLLKNLSKGINTGPGYDTRWSSFAKRAFDLDTAQDYSTEVDKFGRPTPGAIEQSLFNMYLTRRPNNIFEPYPGDATAVQIKDYEKYLPDTLTIPKEAMPIIQDALYTGINNEMSQKLQEQFPDVSEHVIEDWINQLRPLRDFGFGRNYLSVDTLGDIINVEVKPDDFGFRQDKVNSNESWLEKSLINTLESTVKSTGAGPFDYRQKWQYKIDPKTKYGILQNKYLK